MRTLLLLAIYISVDRGESWTRADAGFPADAVVNDFAVAQGIVFAGTDAHGVFLSRDGGKTWTPTGLQPDGKIGAIEPFAGVILVGTTHSGILALSDAGQVWRSSNMGLTNLNVRALIANAHRVFAGTNDGVFASDDAGRTWKQLTKGAQINGFTILGTSIFTAGTNGVMRSDDDGVTWRNASQVGSVHNIANDGEFVYAMDYDREVLRTNNGGATWTKAHTGLPNFYTFQILAVDDVLFAGQWTGIFRSTNRGAQWTPVQGGLPPNTPMKELIRIGKDTIIAAAGQKR